MLVDNKVYYEINVKPWIKLFTSSALSLVAQTNRPKMLRKVDSCSKIFSKKLKNSQQFFVCF